MIRSSNGRIARNAATVAGASASSKRARNVKPEATISSTALNLPRREPACEDGPLLVGHVRRVAERHRPRLHRDDPDEVGLRLDLLACLEQDPGAGLRETGLRRVGCVAG